MRGLLPLLLGLTLAPAAQALPVTRLPAGALDPTARVTTQDHADDDAFRTWLLGMHEAQVEAATWRSPTSPEREATVAGVSALVRGLRACSVPALTPAAWHLARAGLRLGRHRIGEATFVVLTDGTARGAGWSAWRCGEALEVVVQAPHAFFDLDTDDAALGAFIAGQARGLMLNDVHRFGADEDEVRADEVHPADVTRQPASSFHTVTLAAATAERGLRFLQLHGYASATSDADAIVSLGLPGRPARAPRDALAEALDADDVQAWGEDTWDLGGTSNVAVRPLNRQAPARFLHVELSRDQRRRLGDDPTLAASVVAALAEIPWDP